METDLSLSMILQHLEVSLIPWLIVMVVGGGLGYFFAILFRKWFQDHQRVLNLLVLLPWRSVAIWIALVVIYSPLMVWQFGLGTIAGSVAVGVALSSLMIPWITTTLVRSWYPLSTIGKILSIVRLSAILSIALPVFLNIGMGYFISRGSFDLEIQKMTLGYEVVGAMLLGTDIVLGIIQFALSDTHIHHNG
jgi:hypothetical protein